MDNRIAVLRRYIEGVISDMSDTSERGWAYIHLFGVAQACALIAARRGEDVALAIMAGMLHDLYTYTSSTSKAFRF